MDFSLRSAGRLGDLLEAMKVPVFRELQPRFASELRRARRYEHPLSVVVLGPHLGDRDDGRAALWSGHGREGPKSTTPAGDRGPVYYLLLGSYLRNNLRETDLLASAPERLLYAAFLPETDEIGARMALRRIARGLAEFAPFEVRAGIAEFPRDALTVEDLFEQASVARARDGDDGARHVPPEVEQSHA